MDIELTLIDLLGHRYPLGEYAVSAGRSILEIDISQLYVTNGTYLVHIENPLKEVVYHKIYKE